MIFDLERAFQLVFLLDYNGIAIVIIGSLNRRFAFQQAALQIEPAIRSLSDRGRNTTGKCHRSIAILRQGIPESIMRNYRHQGRVVQTTAGAALLSTGTAFHRSGTGRFLYRRTRTAAILQTGTRSGNNNHVYLAGQIIRKQGSNGTQGKSKTNNTRQSFHIPKYIFCFKLVQSCTNPQI